MNISEIRINDQYTHLYTSDYKNEDTMSATKKGESTPIIKRKTIFTENFIMKYKNKLNIDCGMIPPNCRYIENVKDGVIVVIEEPPNIRTVNIDISLKHEIYDLDKRGFLTKYGYGNTNSKRMLHSLTLAFPYVIFIFYINTNNNNNIRYLGQVFLRTTPLFGLGDYLFKMPMLNISLSQDICFGDNESAKGSSLLSVIQKSIMSFWYGIFNNDYIYNYELYSKTPIINNYLEWEYMTKTDPGFIYDVDWILFNNGIDNNNDYTKNNQAISLGEHIKNLTIKTNSQNLFNYNILKEVFSNKAQIGIESSLNKIYKKYDLQYDIAQGILIEADNKNIFVEVGDSIFMNNGNIGYIESFIGIRETDSYPKFILIDLYGKKVHMKLTNKLKEFIKNKIITERYKQTAILKNGVVVKYNDIIIVNNKYMQIQYIRKSRGNNENDMEIKMENNYYLSNQIEGEVLDQSNFVINNIKFKQGNFCILIQSSYNGAYKIINKFEVINLKIDDSSFNSLLLCLKNIVSNEIIYLNSYDINEDTFIDETSLTPISNIFRIGGLIIKYSKEQIKNKLLYKSKNICLTNISGRYELLLKNDINNIIKNGTFHLEGVDFDITFNIGDKVITSNWQDPMDVLNIKTIESFEYNEITDNVYFILKNKNGDLTKHIYISSENKIYIGTIRKVTNKFNELYVGMKIKANETKIACFPKKDTNIIVAIILDINTQPLVLCSNGCTLFYSDVIEKFKLIDIKSKQWNKLKVQPLDINKIKYQPGDIVKYSKNSDNRYVISVKNDKMYLIAIDINYSINQVNSYDLNYIEHEDMMLDCIPSPRLTVNQMNEKLISSYYNFHGGRVEKSDKTNLKFIQY